MTSKEHVQGKARALLGRAAALTTQETTNNGPRMAAGAMAQAVATAIRSGVRCDRCREAEAVVFRSGGGRVGAYCGRCRPKVDNYRVATLQGVVDGWRGRGGETRDRSVATARRRLNAVMEAV